MSQKHPSEEYSGPSAISDTLRDLYLGPTIAALESPGPVWDTFIEGLRAMPTPTRRQRFKRRLSYRVWQVRHYIGKKFAGYDYEEVDW